MTDTEMQRRKAICDVAGVDDIGKLSDGFHTFDSLYEQRMILFAALVKAYKNKAWKSYRHEDGEYCFGGGWFIVGIDTPEGSYTYHYENKYWDMFDCIDLPMGKHWDGHTEADAETRLMSLEPERTPERTETHSCEYEELDFVQKHERIPVTLDVQTHGDVISRQSAIDAMINSRSNADVTLVPGSYTNGWRDGRKLLLDELLQVIFELPSAEPERKTGKWIHDGYQFKGGIDWMHCSECGHKDQWCIASRMPFCGWCGSKMEVDECQK